MLIPFILLCAQTIVFWLVVFVLHRLKNRITIIPLYAYIAILTVLTHNFTDLSFGISFHGWYFLISSVSLFTTLMFATLFLYLFEGPRAGRTALWVILFSSFFYIAMVFLLGFEVDTTKWVRFDTMQAIYYFWSLLAIVLDVVFMASAWELLSRVKMYLVTRVFLITFGVLLLDTLVFTTGAFGGTAVYGAILQANILIRFVLSLIAAPVIMYCLKLEGFSEDSREKPKKFWEIMNFRSDLESKILDPENIIARQRVLERELQEARDRYALAVAGVDAGIWDWDMVGDVMKWSPRFYELLGYGDDQLGDDSDAFKKLVHPEDLPVVLAAIDRAQKEKVRLDVECRLKTASGAYRWFALSGAVKYAGNQALRMAGSIIDINARKDAEITLKQKVAELMELNKAMLGRELKMVELKKEIKDLKGGQ
ncbi:MAG: PAS domain-containing protein [Patescibacteria group bacterium]|nr:PAS domain-containing protein [Patescibacteria group bacterium]